MFNYIGLEGKSYEDVRLYIHDRDLKISEGAVRTALMNYRKDNGFIENPKKGFYRTTERAMRFIEAQERGNPTRQGEEPLTQPIPLDRDAA